MPVPWPAAATASARSIINVADRGITIQQLRDLRLLLQRLCKARLLQSHGQNLEWFAMNMYDIRDFVIKPLIAFLEDEVREGYAPPDRIKRYSWVELIATEAQPPLLLFSHFWGGKFRDFMTVVDTVARNRGLSARVAMFVCTFANSQFGEDLGSGGLEESPFFKAVQAADGTVFVVDRDAGSLRRIWCALEIHFTRISETPKSLQVYTPSGMVGTGRVTSGPLIEALKAWDVTYCEASEDSDRRHILNYLASLEQETSGLKTNEKGVLELTLSGRKQLADTQIAAEGRLRQNGKFEYQYESQLFKEFKGRFVLLNDLMQDHVTQAAESTNPTTSRLGCEIAQAKDRGITLGQLRVFVKEVKAFASSLSKHQDTFSEMTTNEVWLNFLRPKLEGTKCTYMELVSNGKQTPRFVILHAWMARFKDTVDSVEWIAEARHFEDSTVLWFDLLSQNNFLYGYDPNSSEIVADLGRRDIFEFETALCQDCDGLLCAVTEERHLMERAWFMLWLHLFFKIGKKVDFATPLGALACTDPFEQGGFAFGHFSASVAEVMADLKSEVSEAYIETEALAVKDMIQKHGGFRPLDHRIARAAAGPLLREAAAAGNAENLDKISKILSRPGVSVNSISLRGSLGDTPLHVAAATGQLGSLRTLIKLGAEVNAEDHIRETPLHYAALSGKVKCIKLLLQSGADATAESAYAETPLDVAQQNPAAFHGIQTGRVSQLLGAWAAADESDF